MGRRRAKKQHHAILITVDSGVSYYRYLPSVFKKMNSDDREKQLKPRTLRQLFVDYTGYDGRGYHTIDWNKSPEKAKTRYCSFDEAVALCRRNTCDNVISKDLLDNYLKQSNMNVTFKCSDGERKCNASVLTVKSTFFSEKISGFDKLNNSYVFDYSL